MVITAHHKELEDVLMESKAKGVKEPYYVINTSEQSIFVISSGKNGVEFNKTYGYIHKYLGIQTYQCLFGQGVMLMQRNDEFGEAKEFKIVTLHPGRHLDVPAGWASSIINIGKNLLVVLRNSPFNPKLQETTALKEKKGLTYYVVEKKGEIGFDLNPLYKVHPQITSE